MTEIFTIEDKSMLTANAAKVGVRLGQRYRAERRFRFYGLMAIAVAAAFLGVLLIDILSRGLPAFLQSKAALTVVVPSDVLPAGTPVTQDGLRTIDFNKIVREGLRQRFPDVTDRKRRKALDGLVSSGAADDLRLLVLGDPTLIGKPIELRALLSDEADLYLKGGAGDVARIAPAGTANLAVSEGQGTIVSSDPDFKSVYERLLAEVTRQLNVANDDVARLDSLAAGAGKAEDRQSLDQKLDSAKEKAKDISSRLGAAQRGLTLDDMVPTLLVSIGGGIIKAETLTPNQATGPILVAASDARGVPAANWQPLLIERPEANRPTSDQEIAWLEVLSKEARLHTTFNWPFFTSGDSREPELAGIRGALIGSILTLLVTLLICLPLGVAAAIYLEEFAPKNRLTDIIEVNINNLAAVPSIVFGLLGLAVFLNFFGLPRSAPVVGGLVLALLVLPTIIIASRAALKAVPPSIKEAALGVGASHQQAIFHHVLPLALPGIMTGTIIGMAHALGETAPLLMIGMVAFIVEIPSGFASPATALPVQIYLWSDLPEIAFQAKTAAAIIVLLAVLFFMNGAAIYLRRRFERRW